MAFAILVDKTSTHPSMPASTPKVFAIARSGTFYNLDFGVFPPLLVDSNDLLLTSNERQFEPLLSRARRPPRRTLTSNRRRALKTSLSHDLVRQITLISAFSPFTTNS